MKAIQIIKNTYDSSHPLFNGNLQIEDYSGRYMEPSVCLTIDLDSKEAKIEDWGVYIERSSTCSYREWKGRLFRFFSPIRFISRRDLASLLLSLRPLLKEAFDADEINGLLADEIQNLLDDEIYGCTDDERDEIDRQCQEACEECGLETKLNPQWIRGEWSQEELDELDIEDFLAHAAKGTLADTDLIAQECSSEIWAAIKSAQKAD